MSAPIHSDTGGPGQERRPIEVTLAENWAHDNLGQDGYDNPEKWDIAIAAYVAGFSEACRDAR